jgi:hypothetical protein
MEFVRSGDNFIVGVGGPKALGEEIHKDIENFLYSINLKL